MDSKAPSMLRATLIGGALFGALGGIPIVGFLNCFCCGLIAGGGFLAAYLYSNECKRSQVEFGPGTGAGVGLVAGLFHTIAIACVSLLFEGIPDPAQIAVKIEEAIPQLEDSGTDTAVLEAIIEWFQHASRFLFLFIEICVWLLVSAVFSTLGGLIGGAVFKVQPKPPVPPVAIPDAGAAPPPPSDLPI